MTIDDGGAPALANPYLRSTRRPAVWGVTMSRVGLAAAGVLAVTVPGADAAAESTDAAPMSSLVGSDQLLVGASEDVQAEITASCMPAGYLWASEPCDGVEVSPVFTA